MIRTYLTFLLFFLFLHSVRSQDASLTPEEQHALTLLARIDRENRLVKELTIESLDNLPVGIKKTIANKRYIVGIDSVRVTERGIFLRAFAEVTFGKRKIAFGAQNVLFTPTGIDPSAASRLVMISPQQIEMNKQTKIVLPGNGGNYLEWGCDGFRSVNLNGILELSDSLFVPYTKLAGNANKVQGEFEINTSDLSNILLSVGITPFKIKGIDEFAFEVRQASWDMSDTANPPGCIFPRGYVEAYGDDIALWQGFFLKETNVYVSEDLGDMMLQAKDMLIDDFGITGEFSADNLTGTGKTSDWPLTVNRLSVQLAAGRLAGGSLAGSISVPFLGEDTLGYSAQINDGPNGTEYRFRTVFNTVKDYQMPLGGTLRLDKGCVLQIEKTNGRFTPSVILNGALTVSGDMVDMKGLRFEQLHLTARAPYILGGIFASSAEAGIALAGFGINIKDVKLEVIAGKAVLGMNAKVSMMGADSKGISADARIYVAAKVEENGGQKWKYDGISTDNITLDCELSVFKLNGSIGLYRNHTTYGNGFGGHIDFSVKDVISGIGADILFGSVPESKYWFVKFDAPVKAGTGFITLDGITGGAYFRMKRMNLNDDRSDYVPDPSMNLGLMAGVGLIAVQENLFYGTAAFEIAFNKNWGVSFMRFAGYGQFFSGKPINKNAPVRASINMSFDMENSTFHANLKAYMNLLGIVKGVGPDGMLGEAVMHSDPKNWYIYVGRPSATLGIDMLGLARAQAYFMAGTQIEDMPLPPQTVRSIIGKLDLNFMKNESSIQTGRGMGFGAAFNVSAGVGKDKGFVYAYLDLGAGADISLRDFGDASCVGRSGSIGFDGWYASGQAYAYMQGKVGIRARKREFDIMSVGMAGLLQGKMPNPTWLYGNFTAKYRILGGIIKGKVTVDITVGEECKIASPNGELGDIALIADVKPADGGREVDVFAAPQAAFNTSVDTEFSMLNLYDEYNTYRVKFDEFKLVRPDKTSITGEVKWNQSKDVAVLKTHDILPGTTQLVAEVKVHIEKKNKNVWEPLKVGNAVDYEIKTSAFTTGAAPTTVPENNVPYSHPLRNQYHFYKNESPAGYIQLGMGQPDLFYTQKDGQQWNYVARFTTVSGQRIETAAVYNTSEKAINFNVPGGLNNSQVYHLQIVRKQVSTGTIDRNMQRSDLRIASDNETDTLLIAQNRLEGTIGAGGEKVLHELGFRTSSYNTFANKLNDMKSYQELYAVEHSKMSLLAIEGLLSETFDMYELTGGGEDMKPLVYAEALLSNTWLTGHAHKLIYELYGTDPALKLERDEEGKLDELGLMPLRGMWIFNNDVSEYRLEENQKTDGSAQARNGYVTCRYNIAYYIYKDYRDLCDKATAYYVGTGKYPTEAANRILFGSLDDIHAGRYAFKINYRLPGKQAIDGKDYGINFLMK